MNKILDLQQAVIAALATDRPATAARRDTVDTGGTRRMTTFPRRGATP